MGMNERPERFAWDEARSRLPLSQELIQASLMPNSAPRPQAGGGGFLASESHGLATKIYLATGLLLETSALSDWQRAI